MRRLPCRRVLLVVTAALSLLLALAVPVAAQTEPPHVTIPYEVTAEGAVRTDLDGFAADARAILSDARGWTLGGSVAFTPVTSGAELTLVLASPQAVEEAGPVCSPRYSCQVGDRVYINDQNWREVTTAWNEAGGPRWLYRQYLINHEVGHYLGADHVDCPGGGQLAPVMQQQSIALEGCEPNGWPLDTEREWLAGVHDVPIYEWIFPDVLATYVHRDAIHAAAERGIVEGFADGFFRPTHDVSRAQLASYIARALDLEAEGDAPFDDVGSSGAHVDAIAAVAEVGIVEGYDDGTFRPSLSTNRAQMATVIARAYGLEAEGDPPFDDVPPHHPHAEGIAATTEAGITEGYGDGTYGPADDVTRGQLASFITRAEGGG